MSPGADIRETEELYLGDHSRDHVDNEDIKVVYIPTKDNNSDIHTKGYPTLTTSDMRVGWGSMLRPIPARGSAALRQ